MRFVNFFRHSVHVENRLTGQRRDPATGSQDAYEVQWIGCGNQNYLAPVAIGPDCAEPFYGLGQRELLPAEPIDETATPDLPSCLEPPVDAE